MQTSVRSFLILGLTKLAAYLIRGNPGQAKLVVDKF